MAVDSLDSCGIYFGTTGGQVYASADAGDTLGADRARPARRAVGRGADAAMIRVVLPPTCGRWRSVERRGRSSRSTAPVTQRAVLDALEARYPMLRGTIRDHARRQRRPVRALLRLRGGPVARIAGRPLPDGGRERRRAVPRRRRDGRRLT